MKGNKRNVKEWLSATLVTSVVLAGLTAGVTLIKGDSNQTVFAQTGENSSSSKKESSILESKPKNPILESGESVVVPETESKESVKEETKESEKTESKESEKAESKTESKEVVKKESEKETTPKKESILKIYDGGTVDAFPGETWTPVADGDTATTFVKDPSSEGVMYFGNKNAAAGTRPMKFQINNLTNNEDYSGTNRSAWLFAGGSTGELNPATSGAHGIILDGKMPEGRGYDTYSNSSPKIGSIENAVQYKKGIEDYKLYKNAAGTGFKATMFDKTYNLSYTFTYRYDANGGVYRYFSITNNDTSAHTLGAIEYGDTLVDDDTVPINSLGPNEGFSMDSGKHSLKMKLNDPLTGKPLNTPGEGWTNYSGGQYEAMSAKKENLVKYFSGSLNGKGVESTVKGTSIFQTPTKDVKTGPKDSAYILKANEKSLAPGESLTTGSYLTYKDTPLAGKEPVATVDEPEMNIYTSNKSDVEITGKVIDEDSSKGHIEITYPDGTTDATTTYDTKTANKEVTYTVAVDGSKLDEPSNVQYDFVENKLSIKAIDDTDSEQQKPVDVTVNVFNLYAYGIPQVIKVGGSVSTVETDLIKNLKIINKPTENVHSLTIDPTNPSGEPVDNQVVGHYIQDMILTDTVHKPEEKENVRVPVNVVDDDTEVDTDYALRAHDFTTKISDISPLSDGMLNKLILRESEAKLWDLDYGYEDDPIVKSTDLKRTSGEGQYKAVLGSDNDDIEKEITITVTGGLKIVSAPDVINFGDTKKGVMLPFAKENFNLQRQDNDAFKVDISNESQQEWKLTASVTKPLTDGTNTLSGVMKYIDAKGTIQDLESGDVVVDSGQADTSTEIKWAADKGIVANLDGANKSLQSGNYQGEVMWTLVNGPLAEVDEILPNTYSLSGSRGFLRGTYTGEKGVSARAVVDGVKGAIESIYPGNGEFEYYLKDSVFEKAQNIIIQLLDANDKVLDEKTVKMID